MSKRARPSRRTSPFNRLVAVGLLSLHVIVVFGLLPTAGGLGAAAARFAGERYPCEGGRCGCGSAANCWTNCHCQTLAMKIAWAERVGVPVPRHARSRLAAAPHEATPAPSCPLCVRHDPPTASPTTGPTTSPSATPTDHAATEPTGLPTLSPLGCRGVDLLLALAHGVAPSQQAARWLPPRPTLLALLRPAECAMPDSRALETDSPPPRRARA